jgi:hypothetical protein
MMAVTEALCEDWNYTALRGRVPTPGVKADEQSFRYLARDLAL